MRIEFRCKGDVVIGAWEDCRAVPRIGDFVVVTLIARVVVEVLWIDPDYVILHVVTQKGS